MSESCCTADDMRAVDGRPGLTPFLTDSCTLLNICTHRNTVPWLWHLLHTGVQPTPLSFTRTTWFTFVYDITFHCPRQRTTNWRNRPRKRNLPHPLLPYIGCKSYYPCPVTRAILECLGISVYTFHQRVPIIYERNSVGMWKEVLLT